MKIICHKTTEPTAKALAELIGCSFMTIQGDTGNIAETLRTITGPIVNWGYRMRSLSRCQTHSSDGSLNLQASALKTEALKLFQENGVPCPRFLSGFLILRPPMTRKGRAIDCHDGIAMERIDKDLEFRTDVFLGKVFRMHVKTGPEDVVAWNRDGSEWVTFGSKNMISSVGERFSVSESQAKEVIELSKRAVAALGYEFGAVDIIRERGTGKMFVLEVNSAPGLCESGLRKYAYRIKKATGFESPRGDEAE